MHELSNLSLWHATMTDDEWGPPRAALGGDVEADVAIVGAGYTGLWTAYYLLERDPALRVVVLDANVVGFGASGRNGGWCSALLPMSIDAVAAVSSREDAARLQRAMHDTVDEVGRVTAAEGIDCHFAKGGFLSLARNPVHSERHRARIENVRSYGFDDSDFRLLDATEASEQCNATNVLGGLYTPHCAAIHPARLARGLALVVEGRGATIYEHTPVVEIAPHEVRTSRATVRARHIVRATEAFTGSIRGESGGGAA